MGDTNPVLGTIPLPAPPPGIPLPPVDHAISQYLPDLIKKKAIKLDGEDGMVENKEHSKRKHKKSKSEKKSKDRDKDRGKETQIIGPELTAAEKFSMFKKQREASKGDDKIVDDLFKDFIASKIKQIEKSEKKDKKHKSDSKDKHRSDGREKKHKSKSKRDGVVTSVEEMNKFLDSEISNISVPINNPSGATTVNSNITNISALETVPNEKVSVVKNNDTVQKTYVKDEDIPLPDGTPNEARKSPVVFGPMLPRSIAINEKKDSKEEKVEIKKPVIGFKNFGIKLSLTSTELIQSGEVHKKGKRLEEGEVLSSSSGGSDSSDTEPELDEDEDGDDDEISGTGSISDSDNESKSDKAKKRKKKKKKGKHKKKKKRKEKDKDKDDVLVGKEKSGSKRKVAITPRSRSRSPKKSKKSRSQSREKSKRRSRSRSHSKSRSRRGQRSRSRTRRSRSRSRDRSRRSRSRDRRKKSKSPTPDRFWRSKYGDFDAYKFLKGRHDRSKSRSRSPDRERDRFLEKERKHMEDLRCKIDKTKLREIAIKNALSNARSGGPQLDVTFKAGGKSVEELTEYCKKIQEKETEKRSFRNQYDSSSSEEDRGSDDDEHSLHHPFKVREPGAIIMDIKNAKQLPVVSSQERLAQTGQLRLQFPVSSGSQHREKEWVPVEKTEPSAPGYKAKPAPVGNPGGMMPGGTLALPAPPPPTIKQDDKVFEDPPQAPIDIKSLVSERLNAVRKLQENPHDIVAKAILSKAQQKASQWAQSKHLPGQFLGSTGANIMSHDELIGPNKKKQAWLKKDVFTNAAPVSGGIGMYLLQKMGWKHGEGLGKNNEGVKVPLMLDFKVDRKGLVTDGEGKKGSGAQPKMPVIKDLSGKHPVSALGELCNKRRWGAPHYDVVHESGPAHRKDFLFKVKVNGVEYQPSVASNNKKLAKAQAATVCLQELGLVPRTT